MAKKQTGTSDKNTDVLKIGDDNYQFIKHAFKLDGVKYIAKDVLEKPDEFTNVLAQLLAIPKQCILKKVD